MSLASAIASGTKVGASDSPPPNSFLSTGTARHGGLSTTMKVQITLSWASLLTGATAMFGACWDVFPESCRVSPAFTTPWGPGRTQPAQIAVSPPWTVNFQFFF